MKDKIDNLLAQKQEVVKQLEKLNILNLKLDGAIEILQSIDEEDNKKKSKKPKKQEEK